MQRFEGLTFARQGLQVATLVVMPLILVPALIGVLLLVPHIGDIEWLFVIITMACIGLIAWATIKAYFAWAVVPCTVDVGNNQITINLTKRTVFYPYSQKIITMANIRNASCSIDMRLGKSFINIKTHKPKATYMLQYLDERADDPSPLLWQQIEVLVNKYNAEQGSEVIHSKPFFEGGFMTVILIVSGVFFLAFNITLIVDSSYRTWDRLPTYLMFALLFFGMLASRIASKMRK